MTRLPLETPLVLWWLTDDPPLRPDVIARVQAGGAEELVSHTSLWEMATLESGGDHRDPFDRLLVGQGRVEPMVLLTADPQLERCGPKALRL